MERDHVDHVDRVGLADAVGAPDALLNIASAQADLNDNVAARRTLEELIGRYPQSEAATKARQRLGQR